MKSYEDPIKEKSRERSRLFIKKHVLSYKPPRDVRVLCFPGAEQDGQEALEVKSIYDPLGIPRKNILGIEIDRTRYERLCRAGLGIELVHCSDIDLLKDAKARSRTWDVINLDHTSCFNQSRFYGIHIIAGDGLLGNRGVLVTNFMAKRENRATLDEFRHAIPFAKCKSEQETEDLISGRNLLGDINNQNLNLSEDRSKIISTRIACAFLCGRSGLHADFYKRFFDVETFFRLYEEAAASEPDMQYNLDLVKGTRRNRGEEMLSIRDISLGLYKVLADQLLKSGMDMEQFALFYLLNNNVYLLEDHEAYSYVSNSGSPFFQDIFSFNNYHYKLDPFRDFFDVSNRGGVPVIEVLPHAKSPRQYDHIDKKARALARQLWIQRDSARNRMLKDRLFLGSSSRPVLTKGRAIEELLAGATIEQIQQKYRGWENKPLAQWKAHVTMGTYGRKSEEDSSKPIEVAEEDEGLEKLAKEDAIDLLSSGIPAEEIYSAYPTSYSIGQLRAFKAHIKMGTYGSE